MESVSFFETARQSLEFFVFAMIELSVLFVGISFVVGCINEFLPQQKVKKLLSGRNGRGYIVGAVLGGLTPFCSCSTIPMMVGLLNAGAGFGPTMSFLFASPLVNPVLIGLFFTLLGGKITLVYSFLALTLAVISGFILEKAGFAKYIKKGENAHEQGFGSVAGPDVPEAIPPLQSITSIPSFASSTGANTELAVSGCCEKPLVHVDVKSENRMINIFREAVAQFKTFLPYIIIGVAIGAVIHGFIPATLVSQVAGSDSILAVPVSALVGIPLYIRASTMLPIAASLIGKGMNLGAVIALIIGGAGASLPEVTMLKGLFRLPLLFAFLASVFFTAITTGFIMNGVI